MKPYLLALSLTLAPALSLATEPAPLQVQAMQTMQPFAQSLMATLKQGIAEGGPENAIEACNTKAPGLAEQASKEGWQVGRTALRTRNSDNRPDEWELEGLLEFEQRKANGEDVQKLVRSDIVNGEYRFMKAIPTAELCVACHGEKLSAPVTQRLTELYPDDQATGFNVGDLRGAFTLRKAL